MKSGCTICATNTMYGKAKLHLEKRELKDMGYGDTEMYYLGELRE